MYIEAFTTCVGYSDFLSWFLLFNRSQFDNLVVITTSDDIKTQEVCSLYHVRCYKTTAFYSEGQTFGKSQAIDEFLRSDILSKKGWVVHLDADIVLPPRTMSYVREELLDESCIYGIDRLRVVGIENWVNFIAEPKTIYEQEVWLRIDRFPIMPRVFKNGFVPIGFFQAWYAPYVEKAFPEEERGYPTVHENAARADMLQALKWDKDHRKLIANAFAFHLESTEGNLGVNWNGRKTPPFKIIEKQKINTEIQPLLKIDNVKKRGIDFRNLFTIVVNFLKSLFNRLISGY